MKKKRVNVRTTRTKTKRVKRRRSWNLNKEANIINLLMRVIDYLLEDNLKFKRLLRMTNKHVGKEFGGGSASRYSSTHADST